MNRRLASPLRWVGALMLLVTAATHIPLVPEHLEEAPYVGVLFVALSVAAFLASRTVGLPQIRMDIGNWTEPLGFPAVAAEALAALAAVYALRHPTRTGDSVLER